MTTPGPVHTESEAHPWRIDIPDHPGREDSPEYRASRTRMNAMAAESSGLIYGSGPYQDHHGGSLWLKDASGWFMVRNLAGIEWSAQFCADPAKVDLLRQNARRLYALVAPEIAQELDPGGLLDTPITDADGVARWTDSIFNAGVPLRPGFHTGVLPSAEKPAGASEAVAETGDVAGVADASKFDGAGEVSEIFGVAGAGEALGVIEEYVEPAETTAVTEASAAVEATTAGAAGTAEVTGAGRPAEATGVGDTAAAEAVKAGEHAEAIGSGATAAAEVIGPGEPAEAIGAGATGAAGAAGAATAGMAALTDPEPGGVHHYPTPIADIQLFKYDDFQLWVTDEEGNPAAVAPVSRRGSGDACVHVLYATPGSRLARRAAQARRDEVPLILGPDHPISRQAYIHQPAAAPDSADRELADGE
jgi:hypothetical protein